MTGTERKVFQKYYPPDFDPSRIPRGRRGGSRQFVQRVMAPFNMQCNTCREYIYKGRKFNMKRETADGEFYLGLRIFRFYFKCPNCLAEISFKTDLENTDYQMEQGATRLFEAFKLYQDQQRAQEAKEAEDAKDPMKMLEKRTQASRAEMEMAGKIDEMQEKNRANEAVDRDEALQQFEAKWRSLDERIRLQEEQDEKELRMMFGKEADGIIRRRIKEEDETGIRPVGYSCSLNQMEVKGDVKPTAGFAELPENKSTIPDQKQRLSQFVVVKKRKVDVKQEPIDEDDRPPQEANIMVACTNDGKDGDDDKKQPSKPPIAATGLLSLADYGSSSDSDST